VRIVAGTALAIGVVGLVPMASGAHPKAKPPARGAPRIVYSSGWSGSSEIYAVDPSGRLPTAQLTFGPAPACRTGGPPCGFTDPGPSPDGRHLLLWDLGGLGNGGLCSVDLFLAAPDGSRRRQITRFSRCEGFSVADREASWASDSGRFAYTGPDGIHVANADGSHDRRIAGSQAGDGAPRWSRDGRFLTFMRSMKGSNGYALMIVHGGVKQIASGLGGYGYAWSPSGKWIAYTLGGYPSAPPTVIKLVSPDGRLHRQAAQGVNPAWSPDGSMLAFEMYGHDGPQASVVDIARGVLRSLGKDTYPAGWSPDGRTIAVATRQRNTIDLVDAKTGAVQTRLRDTFDFNPNYDIGSYLSWSPDGREFAYFTVADGSNNDLHGDDLRVGTLAGPPKTVVAAAADYGGSGGWAWTRPPAGTRYRAPVPRSIATVSANQLVAPWPIARLVADGDRVAYLSCGHVFVWTPTSQTVVQAEPFPSMSPACSIPPDYRANHDVYGLALAGDRIVYGYLCCNNYKQWTLYERSVATPVRSYPLGSGAGYTSDNNIGDAVGSGSLLVFSRWKTKYANGGGDAGYLTTEQTILRAGPTGCGDCPALRTDPGPLIPDDVDANRISAHGDNAVVVLDANGAQLLSVPVKAVATALSSSDLVVLVPGELRDYDASDGTLMHRWPLPNVPSGSDCRPIPWPCDSSPPAPELPLRLQDAAHGLVTYVLDDQVRLLRLTDGKDVTIAAGTHARFMDAGLVYADGSRLHLVPYDRLPLH
jgi:WD40 repeat protein